MKNFRVVNMESTRGNLVPNQFVIYGDNKVIFQSYESTIAVVDYTAKEITLGSDWDYSRTTGKYRNIFFEDYARFRSLASADGVRKAIKTGNTGVDDGWTVRLDETL